MKSLRLAALVGAIVLFAAGPAHAQCPADINGDDTVNVNDLLIVIGAWGPCAGCAADIVPATSPDGVVNVEDLLALIGAWGPCDVGELPAFCVAERVSPAVGALFNNYAATSAIVVDGTFIDGNGDGLFDGYYSLQEFYDLYVPPGFTGPICLDWEGPAMALLQQPAGSPQHTLAVQQYVLALQTAKSLRPDALTGFYAIPVPRYYDRNAQWVQETAALQPILAESLALFPSVYDFYPDDHTPGVTAADEAAYVYDNVMLALLFAEQKPVYPFVWARYHDSNAVWGYRSIPDAELIAHVGTIFTANYQGDRADGLVWWGADHLWNWISQQEYPPGDPHYTLSEWLNFVFDQEMLPGETREEYFDRIHTHLLQTLAGVIANVP